VLYPTQGAVTFNGQVKILANVANQGALHVVNSNASGAGQWSSGGLYGVYNLGDYGQSNLGNVSGLYNAGTTYGQANISSGSPVSGVDAAGIRTAIGMAVANLDTQLATVAKTGADGDTLETLSDQIDLAALEATAQAILEDTGTDGVVVAAASKTGYALTSAEHTNIADAILKRDWSAVTGEAARSALNALRFLRNKWSVSDSTLTVMKEDDSTSAWTAAVTSDSAADTITGSDPA